LYYEAGVYFDHDIERSQRLYMRSAQLLELFNTSEANEYKAKLWHNYAILDQMSGNDKSFFDITLKYCIPYAEQSGNKELLSSYLSDVGMIFYNHRAYDKSIDYYQQAISVLNNEGNDGDYLARTYVNMAQSQIYQNDLVGARESLRKSQTLLNHLPESKITAFFHIVKSMYHRSVNEPDS